MWGQVPHRPRTVINCAQLRTGQNSAHGQQPAGVGLPHTGDWPRAEHNPTVVPQVISDRDRFQPRPQTRQGPVRSNKRQGWRQDCSKGPRCILELPPAKVWSPSGTTRTAGDKDRHRYTYNTAHARSRYTDLRLNGSTGQSRAVPGEPCWGIKPH